MFHFIIVLLIVCILVILYLSKPKMIEKRMPWIWENIGLPILRHYFVVTVRKVTLCYFYAVLVIAGANPLYKLCFKVDWYAKDRNVQASLDWGNDLFDITSVTIVALLTIAYVCYIIYEYKKLKESGIANNRVADSNGKKLDAVLKRLSNTNMTRSLIPQLQNAINALHIKTARNILEKIRKVVLQEKFIDYPLLMMLEYNIGRCMRYCEEKKALEAFGRAYEAMEEAQLFDSQIAIAKIFCLCKLKEYDKTDEIIKLLKIRNIHSIWSIIPKVLFSEDPLITYEELPVELRNDEELLANLMLLDEGLHFNIKNLEFTYYKFDMPTDLTLDNIPLWALHFTFLQSHFLREWMICPELKNLEETEASKDLYNATDQYLKLQAKTELGKIFPDIDFIHSWVAYIHDHSPLWIDKIKLCSYSSQSKELYYIAVASMLMSERKLEEAMDFLAKYGSPVSMNVVGYRLKIAFQLGKNEEIKEIFSIVISADQTIEDNLLAGILSCIQYFTSDVLEFVPKLKFRDEIKRQLVMSIALFFAEKPFDIEYLKNHNDEFPDILKPYIALIYEKFIGLDEAIRLVEPTVDYHYFDIRSYVYFNLLRKDHRYGTKLYEFCENVRKYGCQTVETLLCELHMAEQLEDFGRAVEITTMMMNNSKQTGLFVEHHLMALFKLNKKKEIAEFYPHLKEYTFDDINSIENIFNVYLLVDMYGEALEFLYTQVKEFPSQEIRDFYYQASINKEIGDLMHKQYDSVEVGSYVMVNVDENQEFVEILLGSQYDALIGKKPGECIDIKLFNHTQHVEVLAIFNKYQKLLMEIVKDIHENKSKIIRSFTIEDLESGDGFLSNFKKISGIDEEARKSWDDAICKYRNGKITLYAFVKESSFLGDLYDKIFGNFMVCSMPRSLVKAKLQHANLDVSQLQPVLDLSGLILMQELSARFQLKFAHKFILPKSIESAIQNTLWAENKGIPTVLESEAISNLTLADDSSKHSESPFIDKLKALLGWIRMNCLIETNKEILNHNSADIENTTHRMLLDSTMLVLNKRRILVSEDWVWSISMPYQENVFCSMSVANWLAFTMQDKKLEIDDYLVELSYLGCEITSDHISRIPSLDASRKKKAMSNMIENIERFKYVHAVDEAAIRLLNGLALPGITNFILNIFVAMFKDMEYEQAIQLKAQLYRLHHNENYRQLLDDAYKMTHPLIL